MARCGRSDFGAVFASDAANSGEIRRHFARAATMTCQACAFDVCAGIG
jgi:hypothetical protein